MRAVRITLDVLYDETDVAPAEQWDWDTILGTSAQAVSCEPTQAWIVGRNQPGYMPESEPAVFLRWTEARDYLVSEMQEYADSDDESNDQSLPSDAAEDDYGTMRADVDSVLRDDPPVLDQEWEWTFTQNDGWPVAFWLTQSND